MRYNFCKGLLINSLKIIFSGAKTPSNVNNFVQDTPDVDYNSSCEKTTRKDQHNISTSRSSEVNNRVQERARKIGILPKRPVPTERKIVGGHHSIFPLSSTFANNSIGDNENGTSDGRFAELCPATQVR